MKKNLISLLLALMLILSGCTGISKTEKNQFPVKVGEVQIKERPTKVVSLSPSLTSTLYALGFGNKVVGVDSRSDRPSAAMSLPSCGTGLRPDVNSIIELGAELVFTSSPLPEKEATALLREDITIVTLPKGNSTEEIVELFHNVVTAMEGLNRGNATKVQLDYYASTTMDYLMHSMRSVTGDVSAIYIAEPYFNLATDDTYMGGILKGMGFTNQAGGEYTNWNFPADKEADLNPDYIFYADHIPLENITESRYYKNTKAVKEGNLIPLDNRLLEEQSPFIFEHLYLTMSKNFPEAFSSTRPSIAIEIEEEEEPKGFWNKLISRIR